MKWMKECQVVTEKVGEVSKEVEGLRGMLGEKEKKILEMDSALYIKTS